MSTKFFIKNIRVGGVGVKDKEVSRVSYKASVRASSKLNLPYRVDTFYADGVPCKRLNMFPFPAGHHANVGASV